MDIDDEDSFIKKCYKCEEPVLDNLNIVYNPSNSKLILWNKYQIFVYADTEFECLEQIFIPEFQIHLLIASNNYLLCLDCNGNVHIISLKFKSSVQKTLKLPFQSRDHGIKICVRYKEDHILSLKYEADTYFLCVHKINTDFELEKKVILLFNNEHWPLVQYPKEKYLLTRHSLTKDNFDYVNKIFKSEKSYSSGHKLVVLSVDKVNIYACLFPPQMCTDEITPVKLYSCPAEICNVEIIDSGELHLLIGLKMGTIIRLSLNNILKTPDVVHLNTALFKMLALKDSLIYSDGNTMWKSENTFSDMKLTQFFLRNACDFLQCGDQIICTTFNKFTYKFSIDDQTAFVIPKTDQYCSAEKLFNNSAYFNKLFEEIEKNNELVKKLETEQHYITALSLSKRQDVVGKSIESSVTVFESYNDANITKCTQTEDIKEYFGTDTWIFMVTITNLKLYEALNNVLSHLSDSINICITLSTALQILKTTCIKMTNGTPEEPFKTVNYLIPLNVSNETEINVNIKILIIIPGALDKKKALTILYKNDIILTSEHFIKTTQKAVHSLKTSADTKELIQKVCDVQYGSIFNFTNVNEFESTKIECSFYVKLPNDYEEIFKADRLSKRYLTPKTSLIMQLLNAEEFLKAKKNILFTIGTEKLQVKIHNDGFSNPLLKVTGDNAKVALNLRNFFANLIYNDYENNEPGKEFIGYSFYTTTENFQKAVKSCIRRSATLEEFLTLMDQFEKNIIGALPL